MSDFLAEIPRSSRETIRVQREFHRGFEIVQLRIWYTYDDGETRPTKKGVTFKPDAIPEIISALQMAQGGTDG
ncbi:MAG: transcriptional coactivator p15/PC4 family protein [Paracoccaceae bacterium]